MFYITSAMHQKISAVTSYPENAVDFLARMKAELGNLVLAHDIENRLLWKIPLVKTIIR